jgi:hypothetical protein
MPELQKLEACRLTPIAPLSDWAPCPAAAAPPPLPLREACSVCWAGWLRGTRCCALGPAGGCSSDGFARQGLEARAPGRGGCATRAKYAGLAGYAARAAARSDQQAAARLPSCSMRTLDLYCMPRAYARGAGAAPLAFAQMISSDSRSAVGIMYLKMPVSPSCAQPPLAQLRGSPSPPPLARVARGSSQRAQLHPTDAGGALMTALG